MDTNESTLAIQRDALEWLRVQGYSLRQMAQVMQCSHTHAARLLAGKSVMTMPEFGNILYHAGFGWPRFTDLPVTHPQQAAPPPDVAKTRSAPRPREPEVTPNSVFETAIYEARVHIMAHRPLPDVELDGHNPTEDMALHVIREAYRGMAARVDADADGQADAVSRFAVQLSGVIAAALARRFNGPQQLELEAFYKMCPDALVTPWDLVASMGGRHTAVDALTLHHQALAAMVAAVN